jgi:hypothetical protein
VSGTDTDLRGLTPIWLLGLALVLGSFITIFAPMVASPDHVKLSDWFGFAGSFAGAMVTLAAAAWAWRAVQGQIGQAENAIEAARTKEEFAARAVLPFALSSLHTYVARVIKQLAALPSPLGHDEKLVAAELPMDDVDAIRVCIRYAAEAEAEQIAELLKFLQIQNSRYRGFCLDVAKGHDLPSPFQQQDRMVDALTLHALLERTFVYARGENYRAPRATSSELLSGVFLNGLQDHPEIMEEIDRREKAEKAAQVPAPDDDGEPEAS